MPDSIRRLTPADADAYVVLRAEMISRERYAFLGVPGDDTPSDPANVRKFLADPEQAIVGGIVDGALVASAGVYREKRLKRRHRAGIWGVYTTPSARGRGLSRRVVEACIEIARTWPGVEVVGLSAAVQSAAAIALYESLGFVRWGVEPDCTRAGGERVSEAHMSLTL